MYNSPFLTNNGLVTELVLKTEMFVQMLFGVFLLLAEPVSQAHHGVSS